MLDQPASESLCLKKEISCLSHCCKLHEIKINSWGFHDGSGQKNLPVMPEMWVQSLGQEDPLEKATHSSTLAWRIPWPEEPGGLHTPHGVAESNTTEQSIAAIGTVHENWR